MFTLCEVDYIVYYINLTLFLVLIETKIYIETKVNTVRCYESFVPCSRI